MVGPALSGRPTVRDRGDRRGLIPAAQELSSDAWRAVSIGYRMEMIETSMLKRWAIDPAASVGDRLACLEAIAGRACGHFIPAAVTAIEPAGDLFARIYEEAETLNRADGSDHGFPSYKLLTSEPVFATLIKANPSLGRAIEVMYPNGEPTPEGAAAFRNWQR
jgi:hypothetical protein